MIVVQNQEQTAKYLIRYYYLNYNEKESLYDFLGFDDETKELVVLAKYNFYRQAIEVFADLDHKVNDLFYYKRKGKFYIMPENITDPQECIAIYGNLY